MIPVKGVALEGSGPGLVRVVGSFTTSNTNAIINTRPSKSNVTITRKAAGVYLVKYAQAGVSLVMADPQLGYATNIIGNGSVAVGTALPGYCIASQDFMSSDGTSYKADSTSTTVLILVFNSTNNALSDIYTLSNTSSKPNLRLSFELILATSSMNS